MATETDEATDRLAEDLKKVMSDAEELLKITANETGAKIGAIRERAEHNLREARRRLDALDGDLLSQTKATVKATDQLVHENPWQAIAIAGGLGLLLGLMSSWR